MASKEQNVGEKPPQNKWPPPMPFSVKCRGIFLAFSFLLSAFFGICVTHFPGIVFLWPFSKTLWRYYTNYWSDTWFHWYLFCLEKINGVEFEIYGDEIPKEEFAIALSNHPSESDWLFYFAFANRYHVVGHTKIVLKDIIRKLPGPGWATDNMEFLFLGRNWKIDKPQIVWTCKQYLQYPYNLLVLIFPEGTDYTPAKHLRSNKFAQENNLKTYDNLLVPRVKGFTTLVHELRPRLEAIYDFTIAYDKAEYTPTFWSAWAGWYPRKIHIHVRRTPVKDIPIDDEKVNDWCYAAYEKKDKLLTGFKKTHSFPNEGKKPFWRPAKNDTLWGLLWFAFLAFLLYEVFTGALWLWITLINGWSFFIATAVSTKFRAWRGLAPPPNYLPDSKDD